MLNLIWPHSSNVHQLKKEIKNCTGDCAFAWNSELAWMFLNKKIYSNFQRN